MKKLIRWLLVAAAMGTAGLTAGCGTFSESERGVPTEYQGQVSSSGKTMSDQFRSFASKVNPNLVLVVAGCPDQTGRYLDTPSGMPGYSRAVTQGGAKIMDSWVKKAGFRMVNRDPYDFGMDRQELGMQPATVIDPTNPASASAHKILGADYEISCAITSYDSDVTSGGGGGAIDAMGVSYSRSAAEVGVVVELTNIHTTELIDSVNLITKVEGQSVDLHFTRFLGDLADKAVTVVGSGSTATVASQQSNLHLISGEIGGAYQLPINYAVTDSLGAGLALLFERHGNLLYQKDAGVKFDFNGAAGK